MVWVRRDQREVKNAQKYANKDFWSCVGTLNILKVTPGSDTVFTGKVE